MRAQGTEMLSYWLVFMVTLSVVNVHCFTLSVVLVKSHTTNWDVNLFNVLFSVKHGKYNSRFFLLFLFVGALRTSSLHAVSGFIKLDQLLLWVKQLSHRRCLKRVKDITGSHFSKAFQVFAKKNTIWPEFGQRAAILKERTLFSYSKRKFLHKKVIIKMTASKMIRVLIIRLYCCFHRCWRCSLMYLHTCAGTDNQTREPNIPTAL